MTDAAAAPPRSDAPAAQAPAQPEGVALTLPDGATTRLTVFPAADPRAPALVWHPAMGVRASFYRGFAAALARAGVHVVTADHRGHGEHSVRADRATDFGYHDMLLLDLPAVIGAARRRFPASPLVLGGHSLGGQLSALYLGRRPDAAAALVVVGTASAWYRLWPWPQRWGVLAFAWLARGLTEAVGHFPGRRVGFAWHEPRRQIRDWARNLRRGVFDLVGSHLDDEALLARLTAPALSVSLTDDHYAPRPVIDHMAGKLASAPVTRWHLAPAELGARRLGHFDWVLAADALAPRLAAWIRQACAAAPSD